MSREKSKMFRFFLSPHVQRLKPYGRFHLFLSYEPIANQKGQNIKRLDFVNDHQRSEIKTFSDNLSIIPNTNRIFAYAHKETQKSPLSILLKVPRLMDARSAKPHGNTSSASFRRGDFLQKFLRLFLLEG